MGSPDAGCEYGIRGHLRGHGRCGRVADRAALRPSEVAVAWWQEFRRQFCVCGGGHGGVDGGEGVVEGWRVGGWGGGGGFVGEEFGEGGVGGGDGEYD